MTVCKLTISSEQAKELIDRLNLISENSIFTSGFSWKRKKDRQRLAKWRVKKYA